MWNFSNWFPKTPTIKDYQQDVQDCMDSLSELVIDSLDFGRPRWKFYFDYVNEQYIFSSLDDPKVKCKNVTFQQKSLTSWCIYGVFPDSMVENTDITLTQIQGFMLLLNCRWDLSSFKFGLRLGGTLQLSGYKTENVVVYANSIKRRHVYPIHMHMFLLMLLERQSKIRIRFASNYDSK